MAKKQRKTNSPVERCMQQTSREPAGSLASRFVDKWVRKLFPDIVCDDSGPCQKPVMKPCCDEQSPIQPAPVIDQPATTIASLSISGAQKTKIDLSPSFSSCISATACGTIAAKPSTSAHLPPHHELSVASAPNAGAVVKGNVIADALAVLLEELGAEVIQIQKEQEQLHARLQLMGSLQGMMADAPNTCERDDVVSSKGLPRHTPLSQPPKAMDGILSRLDKEKRRITAIIAKGTAKLEVLQYAKQEWQCMLNMMQGVTVDAQHAGPLQALIFKDTMGRINAFQERQAQQHPQGCSSTGSSTSISNTPSLQTPQQTFEVGTPHDVQSGFSVADKLVAPTKQYAVNADASNNVNLAAREAPSLVGTSASAKDAYAVSRIDTVLHSCGNAHATDEASDNSDGEQVFMTAQCNVLETAAYNAVAYSKASSKAGTVAHNGKSTTANVTSQATSCNVADNHSVEPVTPMPVPCTRPGFRATTDHTDEAERACPQYDRVRDFSRHDDVMESAAFVSTCMTTARNAIFQRKSATQLLRNDPSVFIGRATHEEFLHRLTAAAKEMNNATPAQTPSPSVSIQVPKVDTTNIKPETIASAMNKPAAKISGIELNSIVSAGKTVTNPPAHVPTYGSKTAVNDAVVPRQTKYAHIASDAARSAMLQTVNADASSYNRVLTPPPAQTVGATGIGNVYTSNHQYAWSTSSDCDVDEADVSEEEETGSGGYFDVSKPLSACALPPPLHFRQLSLQNRVKTARVCAGASMPRSSTFQTLALRGKGPSQAHI